MAKLELNQKFKAIIVTSDPLYSVMIHFVQFLLAKSLVPISRALSRSVRGPMVALARQRDSDAERRNGGPG